MKCLGTWRYPFPLSIASLAPFAAKPYARKTGRGDEIPELLVCRYPMSHQCAEVSRRSALHRGEKSARVPNHVNDRDIQSGVVSELVEAGLRRSTRERIR